ncbi:hypothetical protein C8Q80DRAFT_643542 [Daedaleopsis nitida]|nr:hypothetical protein C8Q80DRAFT_643542 [Daedaleopsis nitida]
MLALRVASTCECISLLLPAISTLCTNSPTASFSVYPVARRCVFVFLGVPQGRAISVDAFLFDPANVYTAQVPSTDCQCHLDINGRGPKKTDLLLNPGRRRHRA